MSKQVARRVRSSLRSSEFGFPNPSKGLFADGRFGSGAVNTVRVAALRWRLIDRDARVSSQSIELRADSERREEL